MKSSPTSPAVRIPAPSSSPASRRAGVAPARASILGLSLAALACGPDSPPEGSPPEGSPPEGVGRGPGAAQAQPLTPAATALPAFPDEAAARGLSYRNVSGTPAKHFILEANGAGVALLDLETDGDLDAVFAQGLDSLPDFAGGAGADLAVFRNAGGGRFARGTGPGLAGWWTGLGTGDVDGDGDTDLVAGGYGSLALLTQTPVLAGARGEESGLETRPRAFPPAPAREPGAAPPWTTSVALLDANRDGVLDLFVGRYLDLVPERPPAGELGTGALALPCAWKGHEVFCGPRGLVPQADVFYRGVGDGTFVEQTSTWLRDEIPGFTLGVAPFDADLDGDTDLYVATDSMANRLWVNALGETGAFLELGFTAGVALNPDGQPEAGMGVAVGDVNRDGLLDLAVTNFSGEPTQLYFGAPRGFDCESYRLGLASRTRELLSWGVHLVDFDGDGRLELFTANGHVYPQADRPRTGTRYGQPDSLFRLEPTATPYEPLEHEGSVFAPALGTRGSAVGDVDGDGAPDLVLARIDGPAALGINRLDPEARRVLVRCLGPAVPDTERGQRTPRDGMGTRVVLVPEFAPGTSPDAEFALLGEVQTARGFQSASSPWLHFGLASCARYARIIVTWPSGRIEEIPGGDTGRRLWIREGAGVVRSEAIE